MPKYSCPLCGRDNFTSSRAVDEHIIKHHVGRLSRKSFEYLIECGVPPSIIVEWCRKNGVVLAFDVKILNVASYQSTLTAFAEV